MKITRSHGKHNPSVKINLWKKAGLLDQSYIEPDHIQNIMPFEVGKLVGDLQLEDIDSLNSVIKEYEVDVEGMIERGEFCT